MKKLNGRETKVLFLLSVIVPVSVLTTLKLSGVIGGAGIATEEITLETLNWEFQRTHGDVRIIETIGSSFFDEGISVTFHLFIGMYCDDDPGYEYKDILGMRIKINSTVTNPDGYIHSAYMVFRKDSKPSFVAWSLAWLDFKNFSLSEIKHGGSMYRSDYTDAYIRLTSADSSREAQAAASAQWYILTPNEEAHQIEVLCELTYYDGAEYDRIRQPFNLTMMGG